MTNPTILPTRAADIDDLKTVVERTGLFPSDMLAELLRPYLQDPSSEFWLTCHLDGKPVGLCYCVPEHMTEGTWNMRALAIAPALQGRGLGAALVAAAEQSLAESGERLLIVDTSGMDDFARTRAFYAKIGYAEEARIRDFWTIGDDKVTFRKAL